MKGLTEGRQVALAAVAAVWALCCCSWDCSRMGRVWRSGSSRLNGSTSPSGSAPCNSSGSESSAGRSFPARKAKFSVRTANTDAQAALDFVFLKD